MDDAAATIGGTTAASRNVIAGENVGIVLADLGLPGTTVGVLVEGNDIGTDATGMNAPGTDPSSKDGPYRQSIGISVGDVNGFTIGGTAAGARNLISGNTYEGVQIGQDDGSTSTGLVIGNWIGTDATGEAALSNGIGISIDQDGTTIGGSDPGEPNRIAFNSTAVEIHGSDDNLRNNSIYANTSSAIALDSTTHANDGSMPPVLDSVELVDGSTVVEGTIDSKPNTEYSIDLFDNPTLPATTEPQAEKLLGTVTVLTDTSGHGEFSATLPAVDDVGRVAAFATDPSGNTSAIGYKLNASPTVFQSYTSISISNIVATFTDNYLGLISSQFSAIIDWGDGAISTGTVESVRQGVFQVSGSHLYKFPSATSDGTPVSVSIATIDGTATAEVTSTAHVSPLGPITFSFVFNDPQGLFAPFPYLLTDLEAAGDALSRLLLGAPTKIVVSARTDIDRAQGGPGVIWLNPQYLSTFWFDPLRDRLDAIPPNVIDAVSVFTHEMVHGLGFYSTRVLSGPNYGQLSPVPSVFDGFTAFGTGGVPSILYFSGPNAVKLYGGPVPLTSLGANNGSPDNENFSHVGNPPGNPGSNLLGDLMNGVAFPFGRVWPSALDLAILEDIGWLTTGESAGPPPGFQTTSSSSPPQVASDTAQFTVSHRRVLFVAVVLVFDVSLDPTTAGNMASYSVSLPGASRRSRRKAVRLASAVYDPENSTVTLRFAKPQSLIKSLTVTLTGIESSESQPLAGKTSFVINPKESPKPKVKPPRREFYSGTNFSPRFPCFVPGTPYRIARQSNGTALPAKARLADLYRAELRACSERPTTLC